MNYYDELIGQIDELIENGEDREAERLIRNELSMPYVPRDIEEKLNGLLHDLIQKNSLPASLSMEQIEEYLFQDDLHQLMAVSQLADRNLRNCIDLCDRYLKSDGNPNAKAYLLLSLILQEIDADLVLKRGEEQIPFNPSELIPPENSEGYRICHEILSERFLKEPSMLKLAEELLYKEALLALPHLIDGKEGKDLALKIASYLEKAFE